MKRSEEPRGDRRVKAVKVAKDERKLALRERPDFSLYLGRGR